MTVITVPRIRADPFPYEATPRRPGNKTNKIPRTVPENLICHNRICEIIDYGKYFYALGI